jgi:hypothetical protein
LRHNDNPHRLRRLALVIGGMVAALVVAAGPAGAQDAGTSSRDDLVVLTGSLVVAEGETVDSAVIFDGPATIDGSVTQSVVVFNGDAEISGTVDRDVVVFNGSVVVRSGATIEGNLISVESPTVEDGATVRGEQRRVSTEFDWATFGFASRFAWWIGYSISTLLLGLGLLALAPGLDRAIPDAARSQTGASIGLGAAAFFLLPILAVLFVAIVIALPLGLFLLLALALLYTIGYVAGAHVLGRRLVSPPKSRFLAFLAGWGILRLVALIPVIGGLAWIVAAIFGLGVLWVAARRSTPAPPASAMPAMPVMPEPTP